MKKNKLSLAYVLIVFLVLTIFYLAAQIRHSLKLQSRAVVKNQEVAPPLSLSVEKILEYKAKPRLVRDPFQFGSGPESAPVITAPAAQGNGPVKKPVTAVPAGDNLVFQGFLEVNGKFMASINDQLVQTGETISGWKVISISRAEAVLEKDGQKKVLRSQE